MLKIDEAVKNLSGLTDMQFQLLLVNIKETASLMAQKSLTLDLEQQKTLVRKFVNLGNLIKQYFPSIGATDSFQFIFSPEVLEQMQKKLTANPNEEKLKIACDRLSAFVQAVSDAKIAYDAVMQEGALQKAAGMAVGETRNIAAEGIAIGTIETSMKWGFGVISNLRASNVGTSLASLRQKLLGVDEKQAARYKELLYAQAADYAQKFSAKLEVLMASESVRLADNKRKSWFEVADKFNARCKISGITSSNNAVKDLAEKDRSNEIVKYISSLSLEDKEALKDELGKDIFEKARLHKYATQVYRALAENMGGTSANLDSRLQNAIQLLDRYEREQDRIQTDQQTYPLTGEEREFIKAMKESIKLTRASFAIHDLKVLINESKDELDRKIKMKVETLNVPQKVAIMDSEGKIDPNKLSQKTKDAASVYAPLKPWVDCREKLKRLKGELKQEGVEPQKILTNFNKALLDCDQEMMSVNKQPVDVWQKFVEKAKQILSDFFGLSSADTQKTASSVADLKRREQEILFYNKVSMGMP